MTILIRAMREGDLASADRIYRLAFGTLFALEDPASFRGDADLIRNRFGSYPDGAFVAEIDREIIGVSLANNWGSLGLLGPVAIHPKHWRQGIAKLLLEPTIEVFARWQNRVLGLFTFPDVGHLSLYQSFGFWPRYLTAVMRKDVAASGPQSSARSLANSGAEQAALIDGCHRLMDTIFPGLDLRREFAAVLPALGDVLILEDGSEIAGFVICHCGAGSEGGSRSGYLKFAVVRSGRTAPERLSSLIASAEDFARRRGATQITAGISAGRHQAHRLMVELGFRTQLQGVAMHRPWGAITDQPEIYLLDDWR